MLNFLPLSGTEEFLREYFEKAENGFCDLSVGVKFMWKDLFKTEYAFFGSTLILKESYSDYENAFYYPIGESTDEVFTEIENYCKFKGIPLKFCCIDNYHATLLSSRYENSKVYNDRNWSDYIYTALAFKTYSGKKLGGQRNHVNKFKKTYPDYKFKVLTEDDLPRVKEFLSEFEHSENITMLTAREEEAKVYSLAEKSFELNQFAGYVEVNGKMISLSIGERVRDTLIVHVEKGLKEYEGVYPLTAQEFALAFADEKVKFINREEDCGDMGLRISKLQYHPLEVKEKNFVEVKTLFPETEISLSTDRLTLTDVFISDGESYFNLCSDETLNTFWGYDYKTDLKGILSENYFYEFQKNLKEKKEEYSLAVRKDGKLIGELVLWNFGFNSDAEIGFRFLKEYQGFGYATESVSALNEYFFNVLNGKTLKCRCYKENARSLRLISKVGFSKTCEDETYYYFSLSFPSVK